MDSETEFYRKKLFLSMIIPGFFIVFIWLVKFTEIIIGITFSDFGIYPLTASGLRGILFSPLIHADFGHLFNNSIPLFFLSTALFYFYSDIAIRIFIWTYFFTGLLVWIAGREAYHIGASGLIYGLASFLFFSGIIRRYFRLVALSLLVVFLYGSMVWGLFPGIYPNISWESHMLGFMSGIVLAVWYRNEGPQEPVYVWLDEDEEEVNVENEEELNEEEGGKEGEGEEVRR